MQPQTWKIHVARHARNFQVTENPSDPASVGRMNARSVPAFMKQLQSPVLETADRGAT